MDISPPNFGSAAKFSSANRPPPLPRLLGIALHGSVTILPDSRMYSFSYGVSN
jgi:hypothetical protein